MSQPKLIVTRRDFTRRSRVILKCASCGTTTVHCEIADADIYEAGFRQHVCKLSDAGNRPSFLQMLGHMAGGVVR